MVFQKGNKLRKGTVPWNKGIEHSKETKEKIRQKALGRPSGKKGNCPKIINAKCLLCNKIFKRYQGNINQSKKIFCSLKCSREYHQDNKHWNYINGECKSRYKDFNEKLKNQIRKRDKYKCQFCGIQQKIVKTRLCVHHIDYDKTNHNTKNLISLCASCHIKTNQKRNEWEIYFKTRMKL